ncbi:MAG: hypothetical protein HY897_01055 [Deltaproteobacteria bacterium]|nr:hypothetical protein [Deltaproteobacteria bacterium]
MNVARASAAEPPAQASPPTARPVDAPTPQSTESGPGWQFHGAAKESFRGRQSSIPDERDQDVDLYLDLAATDPSGRFVAEGAAAAWWDIDGTSRTPGFGLRSLRETTDPALWVDVYRLSAEYRSPSDLVRLARAGRQEAEHGLPEIFDGAAVELRPARWLGLFAFGGRTEHFYELRPKVSEDWLGSAGAVLRPVENLKIDIDYRLLSEDVPADSEGAKTPLTTNSYGVTGMYRFGEWLRAKLYARGLDASLSNAGGAVGATNQERLMGVEVRLDTQTVAIKEINEANDPYYLVLGESLPFARWRLDLFKGFSTSAGTYTLHIGYEGRNLLRDDETVFNRNTSRLYSLFTAADVGIKGPFAGLLFERNSAGLDLFGGQGIWAVGGSAGWDRGILRAEAGTYYQRFAYVYYQDVEELADVRVFFGDVRLRIREWISARTRYQYEAFDRELHTLIVGLTQAW